nr:N-acetyl sugar amidotransferase [Chryseobacterium sp. 6424]
MDTTDPEIHFSEEGFCNHCSDFLTKSKEFEMRYSRSRMANVVKAMKKAGAKSKYDCVLGISGGVDSCYTALMLKKLGIRVLLVHLDNGWNAEKAVDNIQHTADKLGFDLHICNVDRESFRDLQLAFLKASVVEAETPTDMAILGAVHKVAHQNNVKFIISGGNFESEGILPKSWHYNAKDMKYLTAIHRKFGNKKLKDFYTFGITDEIFYKFYRGIKMVYFLSYFNYDKEAAKQTLRSELGWQEYGGKHHESLYTKFIQSYLLPVKFNIDYRKATFSSLICAGKMTREEAMAVLQTPPYDKDNIDAQLDAVASKLGITRQELDVLVKAPAKNYRDYPNDDGKLNQLYRIYNTFFNKRFIPAT